MRMLLGPIVATAVVFCLSGRAVAQSGGGEWIEFGQSRFSMMVADWKVDLQGALVAGNGIRYQAIHLHGAPPPPVNSRGGQGGFGRINAPGAPAAQDAPTPQGGQAR